MFYTDIKTGLNLFVECLEFKIVYDDIASTEEPFCVIERDSLKVVMIQNEEFAIKDRPELRLETDNILEVYTHVKNNFPKLLHPNSLEIKEKPWGAKEFALLDDSGV